MSTFGSRREPKEDHEVDEDQLLATLSSEELQELERELVHLDDNIPAGMRQPDQTSKTPTGGFNRAALLKYWEDEYDGKQVSLLSPLQGGVHFQTLLWRGREPAARHVPNQGFLHSPTPSLLQEVSKKLGTL